MNINQPHRRTSRVTDEYARLLGTRDGLRHALIAFKNVTETHLGPNNCYLPPKHHCRKRKLALDKVAELDKAADAIHSQMRDVMKTLREYGQVGA